MRGGPRRSADIRFRSAQLPRLVRTIGANRPIGGKREILAERPARRKFGRVVRRTPGGAGPTVHCGSSMTVRAVPRRSRRLHPLRSRRCRIAGIAYSQVFESFEVAIVGQHGSDSVFAAQRRNLSVEHQVATCIRPPGSVGEEPEEIAARPDHPTDRRSHAVAGKTTTRQLRSCAMNVGSNRSSAPLRGRRIAGSRRSNSGATCRRRTERRKGGGRSARWNRQQGTESVRCQEARLA